ncbi:esterase/lipase family protein [Tahibacter amnicola]|uniref:Alpha/beta fold hydrolase n=1 Tax=Tahibacter amnicola TaxID=2976241 RepID=A0ABY6BDV0_9GAMM|nr:alpha/beta fold hydrolase [Tahibacter amnicola]UXI67929.1 alpha/beta fold hydrolase [Tahibacter amnicola]
MTTILIPGIKGSELTDSYPLDWPTRWSLEDMVFGDAFENPLDFALIDGRFEANDGHRMLPSRPIRYVYGEIVGKLRAWMPSVPLHVFTYDWRRPIEHAATRLAELVSELQGRQRALGRKDTIHFVTHSMGGLVLRAMLGLRGTSAFEGIGRVVFIAPPFKGSHAAPQMLVAGERDGWFGTDEDYRKIARSFPSVYQLTPHFAGSSVDEAGSPVDLFDAGLWQANVRDGTGGFQARFVTDAEAFSRGPDARYGGNSKAPLVSDAALASHAEHILVLQGAGIETPWQLQVQTRNEQNPNWFDFAGMHRDRFGDGRVNLRSSAIPGITLAAYTGVPDHGRTCRDTRIINTVCLWLEGKHALKMSPRTPEHPQDRRGRSYFGTWDGDPASFPQHIV